MAAVSKNREHAKDGGPIGDELASIDLGDSRLNKRAVTILEALAENSEASVNAACRTWPETKAAYRFFDNDRLGPKLF